MNLLRVGHQTGLKGALTKTMRRSEVMNELESTTDTFYEL